MEGNSKYQKATLPVKAQLHQTYNLNMKINIVGASEISGGTRLKQCPSRQGAPRQETDALDLPAETRTKLKEANQKIMAWLKSDATNQHAFIANPVAALQKAGVNLERKEIKAIERVRAEAAVTEVVTAGLQLRSVKVAVNPRGRVRKVEGASENCICTNKRREK